MEWLVRRAGNIDVERAHLNKILQEIEEEMLAKEFASTGEIQGGALSINGSDSSKLDIASGVALFMDYTDPRDPVPTELEFGPYTGITLTYLATNPVSYIGLDSTGTVQQSATPFTNTQRRDIVSLGVAIHSNNVVINAINTLVTPGRSLANQLHDLMVAIGPLNESGNKYAANGSNLNIDKTAGVIFKLGANFHTDLKNPHQVTIASGTALTFRYRLRDSTEYADTTSIDPNFYDNAGVRTAMPLNKFSIQHINIFQSGLTRIQYGQTVYNTMPDALESFLTETFVTEDNIEQNGIFRAYLIVKEGTVDLTDTTHARFFEVGKYGNVIGTASGAVVVDSIADADTTHAPSRNAVFDALALKLNVADASETIDDRVASLLVAGTNITLTYNDGAGTLTIDAAGGSSTFNWGKSLNEARNSVIL